MAAWSKAEVTPLVPQSSFRNGRVLYLLQEVNPVSFPVKETVAKENPGTIDLGPIPRQPLTRAESFFDDLLSLTLSNKLIRCQVTQ